MRTGKLWFIVCVTLLLSAASVLAQMDTSRIAGRVDRLKTALGLSDAQAAKVKTIYMDSWAEGQKMRDKAGEDREAMREAGRKRTQETDEKIEALLTPEQKPKFEEFKKNRRGPGMGAPQREGPR